MAINTSDVAEFQFPLRPSQHTVRQTHTLTGITDGSEKLPNARGALSLVWVLLTEVHTITHVHLEPRLTL